MTSDRLDVPPTQFGVFYPRGWMVISFKDAKDAESARQALLRGGYDPADVFISGADEVLKHTEAHIKSVGALAKTSHEFEAESRHQALAREGHTFLLAYARSDLDTERVMNVVGRFSHGIAHKYDRFSLHEL